MTIISRLFSLFIILLFSSCEHYSRVEDTSDILLDSLGWFRGYKLGDSPEDILSMEAWQPAIQTDTLIEIKQDIRFKEQTIPTSIFLSFDELGLFEVQADLWVDSDSISKLMLKEFKERLGANFGNYQTIGDELRWTTNSASNTIIEITLSQDQSENNHQFLSLNYLEPLDDKY